jgi:hypothetical protein
MMYPRIPAETTSAPQPESPGSTRQAAEARAPYQPPALERLGPWQAFTLQQSIPIFP